jgi:hypothetical protein
VTECLAGQCLDHFLNAGAKPKIAEFQDGQQLDSIFLSADG